MAETVGALILSAIGATEIASVAVVGSVTVATVVGTAALIGASIGLQYALAAGNRGDTPKPEEGSQPLKQAIPPRIKGYGTNRLAGYYMLFEAHGNPPATAYMVCALHQGRISAYRGFYLHDDALTMYLDITHGGVSQVAPWDSHGRYQNVQFEVFLGAASQTASVQLTTSGSAIPGIWSTDHRGDGVANMVVICGGDADPKNFSNSYPHNLPVPSAICDCALIWDPRDPAQSRTNPATWTFSKNPVLQLIDYLTSDEGGLGLDFATVIAPNLAAWMVEASMCDQAVDTATPGVQEPRYQSNGWFTYDNTPADIIGGILATCDGWLGETGDGALAIVVGVYRAPTDPPITEKHIVGFALSYGQADEQLINQLDISYTDPAQNYVTVAANPWRDEASISAVGEAKPKPLELKWVHSYTQARRLADRAMQRLNPRLTGSFSTTLYGLRYLGRRWVPIKYPFISGLQDNVVEIQSAEVDLKRGRITWQFSLIATSEIEAFDPGADANTPPVVPPIIPQVRLLRENSTPLVREDGSYYMRES
ncbi:MULTISPECIES: phage tail protein [unclassified Bradyrhizobium]|uniref:phage tail protein n=1 Tax=unclassified Bradyrhizobium TaxID=2631580 RepID=UPI00291652D1|nr:MULTISPECIES: phage tail protein [unclassified Bradyrhizobium]